jgi:hypothetical protein
MQFDGIADQRIEIAFAHDEFPLTGAEENDFSATL